MAVGGCDRGCGVSGFLVGPVVGGGDSSMGVVVCALYMVRVVKVAHQVKGTW